MADQPKIDFGALAAERDKALSDHFVELPAFRNLRNRKKFVVLGNWGSGKSAIFKMIANGAKHQKGAVVIELAPKDYSYELLQVVQLRRRQDSLPTTRNYPVLP
jgi:ABC-type proline/glycine betaine transport system ATPase subunit